jgi:uncharacterized protein YkwD
MRTWFVRGALPLLLLAPVGAGAGPVSAATVCASADGATARASTVALANAAVCLVNQERAARGLKPLTPNRRLASAADSHARDMVVKRYFSHESEDGRTFVDRIRRAGYIVPRAFPSLGEDLAWGSGTFGTPREIVQAWMESPDHRRNILNRNFREAGMAVALGDPGAGEDGVVYALDFGSGGRR